MAGGRFTGRRYTADFLRRPPTAPAPGAAAFGVSGRLPQNMQLFLPEEKPIPSATIFETIDVASTAIVQSGILLPAAQQQIPANNLGRLSGVTFFITNLLPTTDVRFTVLGNGGPLQALNRVRIFPGTAGRVSNAFDVYIRIPSGTLLQVLFENNDGGTYQVGASLSGWFWPESDGKRWMQQGDLL